VLGWGMMDRELLHLEVGSYWLLMDWATMAPVKVKPINLLHHTNIFLNVNPL
jgi:hypothetical protein